MNAAATHSSNAFLAIFWGGLACGVLDITQAMVAWHFEAGAKPIRILQSIAAGLLGRDAFSGGMKTAALGAVLHFLIAFTAAGVYYAASRWFAFLTQHAVIAGMLYGEMVWLFMNFVVIPLSATPRPPWNAASIITGPIGHLFLVGLPIALAVRRFSS
jgi:uncharacterized membrane protein YagU involved in acid resistance